MAGSFPKQVENTVGKGEIAHQSLFTSIFSFPGIFFLINPNKKF